ncbi:CHASE3 domain-containing protein [Phenylobacterium sp.]|uniref:CHASE3 domain-containing protein n=1 Tax=Phenylobacterium sp. TaxID=1871053 RepID=UPI0025CBC9CB|nr:CHASE3 domain-containing protein [Phenylobacterium sp.]
MAGPRNDRALIALLIGFAALAVAVLGVIWLTERQAQSDRLVRHTLEVENRLSDVLSRLQDAETGQRGYLLTGRDQFLVPYDDALAHLDTEMAALEQAVADNPRQMRQAARLRVQADRRKAYLQTNLESYRQGDPAAARVGRLEEGRRLMDGLRAIVADMKAEETRLLTLRADQARTERNLTRIALLLSGLAVVALATFAYRDGRRRLGEALAAADSLAQANTRLQAEAASREAAEAQVRQFQKMQAIGQLTGGIAHDFNNMLAIVIGSLDLAKRRLHTDLPKAEQGIDNALDGASRAAELTARLLAFSRQQPLAPRVLDVNKLVGGMSEMLRRTLGEDVQMETALAGGLWRTNVDAAQLENAIVNLCVNARDAMPDGGRLTIETSNAHLDDAYAQANADAAAGQYVMISVSDTGAGMPAEVIERAFEPFYTTKGVGRGTGLGLSQVHGFVKQTHGHVKIYSEAGVGTTIKIYLPRNTGELDAAEGPARTLGELPRGRSGEVVLVVEDDERVRRLSVDALRELGYTAVHAGDARRALSVLTQDRRIDLLFTDVVMPDLNGRRLADKAREARPGLKVLYTTGYTKNAIVHNGMLDADVAFLAKPFTVEQLAVKVRQVLDG